MQKKKKYFSEKQIYVVTDAEGLEGASNIVSSMETDRNRRPFFPQITMEWMFTKAWRLVSFPAVKCLQTFFL
jgi:hypothetical protein